ncbi:ABC transporter ATP-binding protein [Cellulomonas carbonis]|uniref:ABC-type quaternary amine transporter n=1 Tax=Cellulomonas carbonis T26 TaxID=947969 RepID=A0A0A0BMP4_9CELL|nr:ABC transporter ATP-binding protein [Cellulomonas carbonis]KGM09743.1 ABC transporter [Cellulomonas carbonis T26]GGC00529.1 ABC transporter [Cellulomonas carbonis]
MTAPGAGLRVEDVVVLYRDDDGTTKAAVDGLTLAVAPGEVVALLGPSGSGKSSLLRAVAGLEPVARGRVTWDGTDLAGVPVHRRGMGLMFQDGQLFPHRDVARNVAFGLQMQRVPRAERARRVAELLDLVGLAGFGDRDVASLSGGERQRVALARSLAPRPRLLLLDEPLSALDRALRERLADDVRAALTATGTTALFVTHDHDEAFAVADRIAVMDAGHLLQVDPPAVLWHRPSSRRVAEFLGYEAFVAAGSPVGRALTGEAGAPAPDALLAVGPGSLHRVPDGVAATVRGAGFRRGVVELVVDVEGVGRVTVVEPSGDPAAALPAVGTQVTVRADPHRVAVVGGYG